MTRWARGGNANQKKPLDATKWTELKSDASETETNSAVERKKSTKHSVAHLHKHKMGSKQRKKDRSDGRREDVAAELESLRKEASLLSADGDAQELVELEEFVHKDARREARRLKRQEEKRQAQVCVLTP